MIDFRYHLVSLISVFLALAVGIALGAGPLKETIGDTLTGQVDQLRAEKDQLRTDLDDTKGQLSNAEQFVKDAGPSLVAGSLDGRRIAIVTVGDVDSDEADDLSELVTAAGASVSAKVSLAPAWTDSDNAGFRRALIGNLAEYVTPAPDAAASADEAIAAALVFALSNASATAPDALSESGSLVLDLLTSSDAPLVVLDAEITAPADAVLVLVEHATDKTDDLATASPSDVDPLRSAAIAITTAAKGRTTGAVLVDGPQIDGSAVAAVAKDEDLTAAISTVADVDDVTGPVTAVMALNAAIGGTVGHYGLTPGLQPLPVLVQLAPVDRTPSAPSDGSLTPDGTAVDPGTGG